MRHILAAVAARATELLPPQMEEGAGRLAAPVPRPLARPRKKLCERRNSAPRGVLCPLNPLSARRCAERLRQVYGRLNQRQTGRSAGRADASGPPGADRPEPANSIRGRRPLAPEQFRWPSGPSMSSGEESVTEDSAGGISLEMCSRAGGKGDAPRWPLTRPSRNRKATLSRPGERGAVAALASIVLDPQRSETRSGTCVQGCVSLDSETPGER
jgi:hypothetical protein